MDLRSNIVLLDRCPGYTEPLLSEKIDSLLAPSLDRVNLSGARVVLKPNLISARMGTLACTEGAFILAVARWFRAKNARVSVGDSPAFGTATGVLGKIGIGDDLHRLSIPVTDFTRITEVRLPSGIRVGMAADALECDLLVNLPRVKAHAQLRVTLAVKNLFGCVAGMRKPLWHMVHGGKQGDFTGHIIELLSVLPDSITVVDGITAMHQSGPISGQPYSLGIAACSRNPVAMDRALLAVLGIEPAASPLMASCMSRGLNGTDISALDFPLLAPAQIAVNSFQIPDTLHPIRFNPVRFVRGSLKRLFLKLIPS